MLFMKYLLIVFGILFGLTAALPVVTHERPELAVRRLDARDTTPAEHLAEKERLVSQMDLKLSPGRNKAVFWSGRIDGKTSAMGPAAAWAKKNGKSTLEMGLEKAKIDIPKNSPHTAELWDHASKLWADRSKGETHALLGQVRPQSVYNRIEKPALAKNSKVTKHTEHNLNKPQKPTIAKAKGQQAKGKSAKVDVKHKAQKQSKAAPKQAAKPKAASKQAAKPRPAPKQAPKPKAAIKQGAKPSAAAKQASKPKAVPKQVQKSKAGKPAPKAKASQKQAPKANKRK